MAATASIPPRPPDDINAALQALVRHFDRDSVENRKLIRELLERDREAFYSSALDILKTQSDSRGCQYLVSLFVAYDLLRPALCDPRLTKDQALMLARSASRVDSLADVTLAKSLAESCDSDGAGSVPAHCAPRLMEILSEISDSTRILPSLMRLLRHPNPYLRSKAVKMIGRGSKSVRWVQNRLKEADPRIRANAVESLWGVDSGEARALLTSVTHDGNNRVAGNAFAALYRLGDHRVIPDILRMAEHESALFRATAAWVMGESGDPRFTDALAKLLRDSDTAVRTRSLSALGRIKASVAQIRQGTRWVVSALMQHTASSKFNRRLSVALAGAPGHGEPQPLPIHLIVSENGQMVTDYQFQQRDTVESMSLVLIASREALRSGPWAQGVGACLNRKRPSDLWAVLPYLTGDEPGNTASAEEMPEFTASPENIQKVAFQPPSRNECTELWRTILRAVRQDQNRGWGKRHVIVLSHHDPFGSAGEGLVSAVIRSQASVQVISASRSPKVEDFCRRARAHFRLAETDEDVSRCLEMAHLNLLARYDISWRSTQSAIGELRVRVNSPSGWGETAVPPELPAEV